MRIIGIAGSAGAGKDTISDYLVSKGFVSLSFAGALKRHIGMRIFGLSERQVFGTKKEKETLDPRYGKTPREILQRGGEYMRDIHKSIWIEIVFRGLSPDASYVISDVRHINEIEAVQKVGGKVWLVSRKDAGATGGVADHASETELLTFDDYDERIDNNSSMQDLYASIERKLKQER